MRELVNELRGGRGGTGRCAFCERLERDLGIDSLGRTELMLRIEQRFSIQLAVSAMGRVETVGDLLRILNQGKGARAPASVLAITPSLPEVQAAAQARTLLEMLDWHVARHPDRLHATVLQDDSTIIATLSYAGLQGRRRPVAPG